MDSAPNKLFWSLGMFFIFTLGGVVYFLSSQLPEIKKMPACTVTYDTATNTLFFREGENILGDLPGGVKHHNYVVGIDYRTRTVSAKMASGQSKSADTPLCSHVDEESWNNVRTALNNTGNLVGIPFSGQGELYLF